LTSAVLAQGFLDGEGDQPVAQIGGLHDYIFGMNRETLMNWALTTEKYHRNVNNQHQLGGLDDYINRLSNQELINYILKEAEEHPEIANQDKLNALINEYKINYFEPPKANLGGDGGLHDFIFKLEKEKLMEWALATEAYHRDVKHQHFMGGLDDYITSLSKEQIIEYIMKEIKEHPEIANQEKLDSLANKYNIKMNSVHEEAPKDLQAQSPQAVDDEDNEGLGDILFRTNRATLNKWALACEKYHRQVKNIHVIGGLNDYVTTLSDEQVMGYIVRLAREHPEIGSPAKLNELVSNYHI